MALNITDFDSDQQRVITIVFDAFCHYFDIVDQVNVDVCYVDAEEIRELNRDNRGVDAVTDVLSFPNIDEIELPLDLDKYSFDISPEDGRLELGSVVICMDRLIEQAAEYGNTLNRELSYLTVHSLLHLMGYDHMEEEEKREMRRVEEEILARCDFGE